MKIRSGDYCKCEHCGYEGFVYGAFSYNIGLTHPWCPQCGINNKLFKIKK